MDPSFKFFIKQFSMIPSVIWFVKSSEPFTSLMEKSPFMKSNMKMKPDEKDMTISSGLQHALFLKDGRVYSAGSYKNHHVVGHMGEGKFVGEVPLLIGKRVKTVACQFFSCLCNAMWFFVFLMGFLGLTFDGKVYSWGSNPSGELGHGDTTNRVYPEEIDFLTNKNIKDIETGAYQSFCWNNDNLYSWGVNKFGELALGYRGNVSTPQRTVLKVKHLICGVNHFFC